MRSDTNARWFLMLGLEQHAACSHHVLADVLKLRMKTTPRKGGSWSCLLPAWCTQARNWVVPGHGDFTLRLEEFVMANDGR